jgi:hypothetical protein
VPAPEHLQQQYFPYLSTTVSFFKKSPTTYIGSGTSQENNSTTIG